MMSVERGLGLALLLVLASAFLVSEAGTAALEEALFQSFVANYSKEYRNEPDVMGAKFKVFQV